jgi:hypothetical protein
VASPIRLLLLSGYRSEQPVGHCHLFLPNRMKCHNKPRGSDSRFVLQLTIETLQAQRSQSRVPGPLTTTRNWENSLDELVQDCRRDGENVFDENIRKAGVLDAASFSTYFNPYDFGIVDAVAQELLPGGIGGFVGMY